MTISAVEQVRESFDEGSVAERVLLALIDAVRAHTRFMPVSYVVDSMPSPRPKASDVYEALHWLAACRNPFLREFFKFTPTHDEEMDMDVEVAYRAMAEGRLFHENGTEYTDFAAYLFPYFVPTQRLFVMADEARS